MSELVFYDYGAYNFYGDRVNFKIYKKRGNIYYLAIETYRDTIQGIKDELIYELKTKVESKRVANAARIEMIAKEFILYTISSSGKVQTLEAGDEALGFSPKYILVVLVEDIDFLKAQCRSEHVEGDEFPQAREIKGRLKQFFDEQGTE